MGKACGNLTGEPKTWKEQTWGNGKNQQLYTKLSNNVVSIDLIFYNEATFFHIV